MNKKKKSKLIKFLINLPFIIIGVLIVGFIINFIIFSNTYVSPQEEIIRSISDNVECIDYYSAGFRDFTDFGVFSYKNPDIKNAEKFEKVKDFEEIHSYVNNFNDYINTYYSEKYKTYNFNIDMIDKEDYYYIYDKSTEDKNRPKYDFYDVYFFDSQTQTLYYFHNDT